MDEPCAGTAIHGSQIDRSSKAWTAVLHELLSCALGTYGESAHTYRAARTTFLASHR